MQIKEEIKKLLEGALDKLDVDFESGDIALEHPADLEHGDYSSNIAMVLAKKMGKMPRGVVGEKKAHTREI